MEEELIKRIIMMMTTLTELKFDVNNKRVSMIDAIKLNR